jgi:hypothetical protein
MRIDFTSYIDKAGYKIASGKRPPRRTGQSEADWVLDSPLGEWVEARVVGLGGAMKKLHLSNYPKLFAEFANVRRSEELLNFITQYGPLTKSNEIPQLLDAAKQIKGCWSGKKLPSYPIADLKTSASAEGIKFRPARLLDALWLQLAEALSAGTELKQCRQCGIGFPVGGKSGLRIVAKFCSDECRIDYNSLKRSRRK